MRWFIMKESRTLETFVFFLFLSFSSISTGLLSKVLQIFTHSAISVSRSFSKWKKDGGKARVYPHRKVNQHERCSYWRIF